MPTPYDFAPAPLPGQGVYGMAPGITPLPNPAGDLGGQIPGLAGLNAQASQTIQDRLAGSISPATMKALQDAAATYGATTGMPGLPRNGLAMNRLFGNIAGFAENQASQGLQNYNQFVPTVSGTQTVNPALQANISESNAVNRAAPNPTMAGSHAESLFNKYLSALRGGGPGGGTRIGGGGGGGARDALGFPITPDTGYGAGGPPEVVANSLGSTISRSGGWGLGSAGTPITSGNLDQATNDFWDIGNNLPATPQNRGTFYAGSNPGANQDQWMNDFWSQFDIGNDVPPGSPGGGIPLPADQGVTRDWDIFGGG